jgi:hypothetical protein
MINPAGSHHLWESTVNSKDVEALLIQLWCKSCRDERLTRCGLHGFCFGRKQVKRCFRWDDLAFSGVRLGGFQRDQFHCAELFQATMNGDRARQMLKAHDLAHG